MSKSRTGGHTVLWAAGILLLVGGIAAFVLGLWLFGSAASSSAAVLDPDAVQERVSGSAFFGVILLSVGAMITPVGGVMTGIAFILDRYPPGADKGDKGDKDEKSKEG